MLRIFSDEKNRTFIQDRKVNVQNERWMSVGFASIQKRFPLSVPTVMHSKFLASAMLLAVVSNEGDMMLPVFFQQGLRVNAEIYIQYNTEILRSTVKP